MSHTAAGPSSLFLVAAALCVGIGACGQPDPPTHVPVASQAKVVTTPAATAPPTAGLDSHAEPAQTKPAAGFVTSRVCADCHPGEAAAWRGSHHDMAMRHADAQSVRGNFDDAEFMHKGVAWRFSRRESGYFVETQDSDGEVREFEVLYTFGVEPLQQYLVARDNGALHALSAAWDSRSAADGGGRWFSLHADKAVPPDDVMHWTGPSQKWNTMCADCHSTGYSKKYDAETRRYDSSWSDINVGCEACHGAGERHVAWAERWARKEATARTDPTKGLTNDLSSVRHDWKRPDDRIVAVAEGSASPAAELSTCAPCHSLRSSGADPTHGDTFLDRYRPTLLEAGRYYADGQILDEVYVWGSFIQSRMHAAGVTCSDCHDPHSLELRASGDGLCLQCHSDARYASTNHHHHQTDGDGARCVSCHMPARTYMVIDARRDHSFRVPRPDLSVKIGVPNACTDCHTDRSADWAAEQVTGWPNARRVGMPHFGEPLAKARNRVPGAARDLADVVGNVAFPAIVRATALIELSRLDAQRTRAAIVKHRDDDDPLVRFAAAQAGDALPPNVRLAELMPLVTDASALVRGEAGRALAGINSTSITESQRADIARAIATYEASQTSRIDEPDANVNIGLLRQALGETDAAEKAYRNAIETGAYFLPAYINLADLYRQAGRDRDGESLLLDALERAPDSADVHHALGLHRVRAQRTEEALASLEHAARLAPENVRYVYVYAVALDSVGRIDEALRELRNGLNHAPEDPTLLQTLISLSVKAGRGDDARRYIERLRAVTASPHAR